MTEKKYHSIVGILYGTIGVIFFLLNVISRTILTDNSPGPIRWHSYLILSIAIILLLLSILGRDKKGLSIFRRSMSFSLLNKWVQFSALFFFANFYIIKNHKSIWAIQLIFIAGMLGLKYRLFSKRGLITIFSIFSLSTLFSSWKAGELLHAFSVLLFAGFFFGSMTILYKDELQRYFRIAQEAHAKVIELKAELQIYRQEVYYLEDYDFPPREIEILRFLCLTFATDKGIAEHFKICVTTVKKHIQSILIRTWLEDRNQVIGMFRHEFIREALTNRPVSSKKNQN